MLIIKNISKHIALSKQEEEYFLSLLKPRKLKKRQFLFHENEVVSCISFVNKGCLRSYAIDDNGFEHILQFAPEDWWIGDMASAVYEVNSKLNIDAIDDTEVLMLSRQDQLKLFEEIPKFERFFRIIIEKSIAGMQQRLINNLSLTAKQRYEYFCKSYPSWVGHIPQKNIASYIGVTPEFLSKMKAESLKKS